ncbi:nucleoside-triphosphatase [Trichococcus collinsii]|uniref:Nucleoside-triphosphatase THEP1 n=1 Tax=Trichococcus collinsii TaxID=157076 RepID=A0AB37ZZF2_9LACT|nr:nucleoside-triphosphatase [Trichococcus collinsii]CZR06886.1 nucleoside-triphosphatase thep1 type [Trichococcus collinsii]SEA30277.1 Nucleoside-triphosphatase THEP1 [Trichococcus collinsii]
MGRVNIITGEMDAGKTAELIRLYHGLPVGTADGFASIKAFSEQGAFEGYDLKRLATGVSFPFIRLNKPGEAPLQKESFVFDRFTFLREPIEAAEQDIQDILSDPLIRTVLLDEIGPIELQGNGFCKALKVLLESDKDLYLCINRKTLDLVVKKFEIGAYHLIEVENQTFPSH